MYSIIYKYNNEIAKCKNFSKMLFFLFFEKLSKNEKLKLIAFDLIWRCLNNIIIISDKKNNVWKKKLKNTKSSNVENRIIKWIETIKRHFDFIKSLIRCWKQNRKIINITNICTTIHLFDWKHIYKKHSCSQYSKFWSIVARDYVNFLTIVNYVLKNIKKLQNVFKHQSFSIFLSWII